MKKCPLCQMTVKADKACPICHYTITYEPEVSGRFEKKKLNKYLGFYLLRRFLFVTVATVFCIIMGLFIQKGDYWFYTITAASGAFLTACLERILTMHLKFKVFETFMWVIIILIKYVALLIPVCWGLLYLIFN